MCTVRSFTKISQEASGRETRQTEIVSHVNGFNDKNSIAQSFKKDSLESDYSANILLVVYVCQTFFRRQVQKFYTGQIIHESLLCERHGVFRESPPVHLLLREITTTV